MLNGKLNKVQFNVPITWLDMKSLVMFQVMFLYELFLSPYGPALKLAHGCPR